MHPRRDILLAKNMAFRERFKWLARQALLLGILLAVAFLSAVTAMRLAIQGREVEVPRVVGLRAGDAQAVLGGRQLGMRIADRAYSNLAKDSVVRQSPLPGARVKSGQRVQVVLSLGPQKVTIPSLEGKNLRTARIELLRAGLQVGEVSLLPLGEVEPGIILQQNPPGGATNAGSPRVNLLVVRDTPDEGYLMPDLVGLPLPDAQRRLTQLSLRLAKIIPATAPGAPRGTVLQQMPARGARVFIGTSVELNVVE
jgi:serine/threonine-protein kinase